MSKNDDAVDILTALRRTMDAAPKLEVPMRLEMHPSMLERLEALFDPDRYFALPDMSPWDGATVPVVVDARLARFAVRLTYVSGRQELLIIAPEVGLTEAYLIDVPPMAS